jgi:peptidoglycan hydrolase-like protein with peptidoglycan-binding domain
MPSTARRTLRALPRRTLLASLALLLTVPASGGLAPAPAEAGSAAPAARTVTASSIVTPGDFVGYGFDQCLAPTQSTMDRWLQSSPFLAVGIYISGDSRGCRSQPNLTPKWIRTQLRRGWRLLPITLGPQASCQPSFPRYGDDRTIVPRPGKGSRYAPARRQGKAEATKSVGAATDLGIAKGSTLWYDLEGFDLSNTRCRESALAFLSAWTTQVRALGFVSGVYSSAGSGIKMLDDARANGRTGVALPDYVWIARWDGKADTSTSYVRDEGWRPHRRVKQYQGGHNETWGGVTINIDRNFLDVGRGMVADPETHCGGVRVSYKTYPALSAPTADQVPPASRVKALQCLLTEAGYYSGAFNGRWTARFGRAVTAWQAANDAPQRPTWTVRAWVRLLATGPIKVAKTGSTGNDVRRLQRALNASVLQVPRTVDGLFDADTAAAVRGYQDRVGLPATGIANTATWQALQAGKR